MKRGAGVAALLGISCLVFLLYAGHEAGEIPRAPALPPAPRARILFVGDLFFDRSIRQVIGQRGGDFIFSCIDPLLRSADLVVGNLEGPITSSTSVSLGSAIGSGDNYRFTFATSTASLLYAHNIRVVNLGNNHIENFGASGVASTRNYLTQAGVGYFGGVAGEEPVYRAGVGGVPLSFVSYNQFGGDTPEAVAKKVSVEHAAGRVVVVFAHWGEEYAEVTEAQRAAAALFAESGAAAVVGSHPHVVQSREYIGATPVYYSLGNFIFDQYWSEQVRSGRALMLVVSPGSMQTEEIPVRLESDRRTCPF